MLSYESTVDDINSSGVETAVIPIGSLEQHGPHLPVDCDNIIASGAGKRIAERLNAFLLPAIPVSTCREHMGKKGSVWMKPVTFYNMVCDIVLSLKEQGFKTIIIVQGHGGIFMLGPTVRELNAGNPGIRVIKVDLLNAFPSLESAGLLQCKNNLHACEYETSLMLYLREDLVRKELIEDSLPQVPRDYLNYAPIFRFSKNGVWGAPSLATKEKGRLIMEMLVEKSVEYVNDVMGL